MNIQDMDEILSQILGKPERVVGVCEMETDTWACSNLDTLTETYVRVWVEGDHTELRRVCPSCGRRFGE
jgi:hypothetical protein